MAEDLFSAANSGSSEGDYQPLAALLRPTSLEHYFGQEHILGIDKPLRRAIDSGALHSMVFWGPPGVGKTTLARILSTQVDLEFLTLSAVTSGVKDIRQSVDSALHIKALSGRGTVLFVDEVHRFNKAQQDGLLPFIEDGTFIFIGATTENPSFELNNALISRCKIYVLKSLSQQALTQILEVSLARLGNLVLNDQQRKRLVEHVDGDARKLLNLVEIAADLVAADKSIAEDEFNLLISDGVRRFDKCGDQFYDQISALHKSVRGSDPQAAIYWLTRMIDGGCDPRYIARRLLRMASEDIGNADPRAMEISLNAWQAYERLGSPEGELALTQAVVYLACAPKSTALYDAYKAVHVDIQSDPSYEVPMHLRNAPTTLMKDLGHGAEYRYAHNERDHYAAGEEYLPKEISDRVYYRPSNQGLEKRIAEKLAYLAHLDEQAKANKT